MHINIECKAQVDNIAVLENALLTLNPVYIGVDHQIDTYFNVPTGRLKLREGNIENSLIYYERSNIAGSKLSNVYLYQHIANSNLKELLTKVHGIKCVVDKIRKIYFVDNVKFHFDTVANLGSFIEIEAIDTNGTYTQSQLQEQCNYYTNFFNISNNAFIAVSYSDLIMKL